MTALKHAAPWSPAHSWPSLAEGYLLQHELNLASRGKKGLGGPTTTVRPPSLFSTSSLICPTGVNA